MRSPVERDEQTLVIAASLFVFVGILAAGILIGLVVHGLVGVSETTAEPLGLGLVLLAGLCAVGYLVRHNR